MATQLFFREGILGLLTPCQVLKQSWRGSLVAWQEAYGVRTKWVDTKDVFEIDIKDGTPMPKASEVRLNMIGNQK